MARVTGVGGIFFKSKDPKAISAYYREVLGVDVQSWGGAQFSFREKETGREGCTIWSPFPADTKYFEPSEQPWMLNLRVDDLDGMLAMLRDKGARVLDRREETGDGKFGYVVDPDGTLIELWEPPNTDPSPAVAGS